MPVPLADFCAISKALINPTAVPIAISANAAVLAAAVPSLNKAPKAPIAAPIPKANSLRAFNKASAVASAASTSSLLAWSFICLRFSAYKASNFVKSSPFLTASAYSASYWDCKVAKSASRFSCIVSACSCCNSKILLRLA